MLRARLLVAVGTCALLLLLIVSITGGFTIRAGILYFAAHAWRGPLLVALAAFGAAAFSGRAALLEAMAAIWPFVDRHAVSLAIVIAAAAAGAGIAFGTYAASSSDASGYVSEARLLASARITDDEPLAREVAWPNATWAFAPLGYRPGGEPGELSPTYPAGLPLAIAPVRRLGGELAAYLVVPFLGALAVLCAYALGARLHSRHAGIAAAALLATSPIALFQLVQPMSDVAVTAWWSLAFLFALSPIAGAPLAAGAAAGLAVLTRPNLVPLAIVAAVAMQLRLRRPPVDAASARQARLRRMPMDTASARQALRPNLFAFAAGITPAIGALALTQWRLYGNPLGSGYGPAADLFAMGNIAPNIAGYGARILHGESGALGLAALALAVLVARRTGDESRPIGLPLALAALAAGIVVALYLPYGVFAEWSYLRFLLPAFPLLFVLVGALLATALMRLPSFTRGIFFLAALTLACSTNIVRAEQEQAFNLRRYESRYRSAGRYMETALPPTAVIVTVQESGSARYYADVPILRWDQLGVDLDTAVAALRALGRHPVLLVEDWERPDLQRRFPASVNARLDWPARAEFGDETRVHLFDPADRGTARSWAADRVH